VISVRWPLRMSPPARATAIRSTAELFGQMFSYLLETRHRTEEAGHEANARALHNRIASAFAELNCLLADVPGFLSGVANYIASEGIGAYRAGMVTLIGLTPSREEFLQLVKFLNKTASGRPWRDISTCLGLIA
jgi:light-regulated signal transduction histidine kinase (bacteriophytochrome)